MGPEERHAALLRALQKPVLGRSKTQDWRIEMTTQVKTGLPYLSEQTDGMTAEECLRVDACIVGAASVWLEPARWQAIVAEAVSHVKAARP
jgi:hypothetical protein